ncbi:ThiF family adenylyltransferase [Shewanella sp. 10N.261.52.F9]|uniref:HesA/MoeB/ThiF family protein n=1 Tax=Shewanella sp. 10N.261.52.F9 TaxID=3229684 RepID=UPI00354D241B
MPLTDKEFIRYSRQILLPEVGEAGQQTFADAKVVIIGIGGLGHLVAQYLAAAGIGHLTLVDGDTVEVSNLPRQLLFDDSDLGLYKALVAKTKLRRAYEQTGVSAVTEHLNHNNAESVLNSAEIDLLLDCSDNFATRHFINQLAIKQQIGLVSASAAHFQGQLLSIDQHVSPQSGCYHCLFPADMRVNQSCQTVGVLGPMVGTLASMQALMALQLIMGNKALIGKLYRFDGNQFSWREARLLRNPECMICGNEYTSAAAKSACKKFPFTENQYE